MELLPKTNAGQSFGIAGLILGIIALLISFIYCIGFIALIPGVLAIVLSIVGLVQARKGNGSQGLIISALVVSIASTVIALIWLLFIASNAKEGMNFFKDKTEIFNENENMDSLENTMDKLEEQADTTDFKKSDEAMKELEGNMDKLEGKKEEKKEKKK